MRWQTFTGVAITATQFVSQVYAQTIDCRTLYNSTSTTKVPRTTTTKTEHYTWTSTTYELVSTTTTISTTYISVVGKKTKTIPTGPSFTPLTSCPTTTVTYGAVANKRDVAATPVSSSAVASSTLSTKTSSAKTSSTSSKSSTKTTKFPQSVVCTTTSTSTRIITTRQTLTNTATSYATFVSTSQVSTSTAYAACSTDNVLSRFHGRLMLGGAAEGPVISPCDGDDVEARMTCLNAKTCCEAGQRGNYRAFSFYIYENMHECYFVTGDWSFSTAYNITQEYVFGNGPSGSGVFTDIIFAS